MAPLLHTTVTGQTFLNGIFLESRIGKNGITKNKREGDGCTPSGLWRMEKVFYRADRMERPSTTLPVNEILPDMGWCDEPLDSHYNTLVNLPFIASHEKLWRDDEAYNLVVTTNYNTSPIIPSAGSAIFIHLLRKNELGEFATTEGCLALGEDDLRRALLLAGPESTWQVDEN
jgi:L,D-peptidoglycan transpeptidase YkuD (ErfK/YbiS/YcfS/YnhG family)